MAENTGNQEIVLNPLETRVLGSLIEKEITTPEYYPLTLNATLSACNQKSNRDPVLELTADQVQKTLDALRQRRLIVQELAMDGRVPKYRQCWTAVARLGPEEKAVLAELMLRGPQTLGELRGRCARMNEFADLNQVQLTLDGLSEREAGPLVMLLPRQAGMKERRYTHLLGGAAPLSGAGEETITVTREPEELECLRQEVAALREEVAGLSRQFQEFRRQFE